MASSTENSTPVDDGIHRSPRGEQDSNLDKDGQVSMFCKMCLSPYEGKKLPNGDYRLRCTTCNHRDIVHGDFNTASTQVSNVKSETSGDDPLDGNLLLNKFMKTLAEAEKFKLDVQDPNFADDDFKRYTLAMKYYEGYVARTMSQICDLVTVAKEIHNEAVLSVLRAEGKFEAGTRLEDITAVDILVADSEVLLSPDEFEVSKPAKTLIVQLLWGRTEEILNLIKKYELDVGLVDALKPFPKQDEYDDALKSVWGVENPFGNILTNIPFADATVANEYETDNTSAESTTDKTVRTVLKGPVTDNASTEVTLDTVSACTEEVGKVENERESGSISTADTTDKVDACEVTAEKHNTALPVSSTTFRCCYHSKNAHEKKRPSTQNRQVQPKRAPNTDTTVDSLSGAIPKRYGEVDDSAKRGTDVGLESSLEPIECNSSTEELICAAAAAATVRMQAHSKHSKDSVDMQFLHNVAQDDFDRRFIREMTLRRLTALEKRRENLKTDKTSVFAQMLDTLRRGQDSIVEAMNEAYETKVKKCTSHLENVQEKHKYLKDLKKRLNIYHITGQIEKYEACKAEVEEAMEFFEIDN
jgi:hypothetical protein